MSGRTLHLELLLGKEVRDSSGEPVGRIEEIIAKRQGDDWVVEEYLLGPAAAIARLSAGWLGRLILPFLRRVVHTRAYRVRWDQLDLGDPAHPRVRGPRATLRLLDVDQAVAAEE